jgi:N-acetylmuramoyl-L-alanine amidase
VTARRLPRRLTRRALLAAAGITFAGYAGWRVFGRPSTTDAADPLSALPLRVIRRNEWSAAAPLSAARLEPGPYHPTLNRNGWRVYDTPLTSTLHTLAVHHSALPAGDGPAKIQALHQGTRGFADIGYHFVIDAEGHLFEGRALNVRGAHVGGHNTGAIGACLQGNFETSQPTAAQVSMLETLAIALRASYSISRLAGHRDFPDNRTVCPGAALWPQLPALAGRAQLEYGPAA